MVTLLADGWHGPGPWVLVFPLFWLLLVVLVVAVLRRAGWRRRGWCGGGGEHAPLAVLGRRYAQGEIDAAEYRERRSVLTEEHGADGGKR
ncbi:SHOCT domain-containing protein [Kitasatospora phosalacinea]|uniref:SHOCT domain-containing protein n=1 Tax=Kitasatospora phosalacinea TaxID=2065 RepID=UPI003657B701